MLKLQWFHFCMYFILLFKKSQELNGVIENQYSQEIEKKFMTKYQHPFSVPPWDELRSNETMKLRNLCVLAWNLEIQYNDYVRVCSHVRHLKENGNFFVLLGRIRYPMDTLACYCDHVHYADVPSLDVIGHNHPFFIASYSDTEYFVLEIFGNQLLQIRSFIEHVIPYTNIQEEEMFYDTHPHIEG